MLRFRVLEALAHESAGDPAAALSTLAEALALAAPEGYLRVFLDEGAPDRGAAARADWPVGACNSSAGVPSRRSSSPG